MFSCQSAKKHGHRRPFCFSVLHYVNPLTQATGRIFCRIIMKFVMDDDIDMQIGKSGFEVARPKNMAAGSHLGFRHYSSLNPLARATAWSIDLIIMNLFMSVDIDMQMGKSGFEVALPNNMTAGSHLGFHHYSSLNTFALATAQNIDQIIMKLLLQVCIDMQMGTSDFGALTYNIFTEILINVIP